MFGLGGQKRGDTLVEVILAFSVFTLVAVGVNAVMNRGIALAEQSLETTLVRSQIDAQAELLRYARSVDSAAWQNIKDLADNGGVPVAASDIPDMTGMTTCPSSAPAHSFVLNVTGGDVTFYELDVSPTSPYAPASVHSQFDAVTVSGVAPTASGMWVVPIEAETTSSTIAYDMHIGSCWDVPGSDRPFTLGTIVRLYDTVTP